MNAFDDLKSLSDTKSDIISSEDWKAIQPINIAQGWLWHDTIALAEHAGYPGATGITTATAARLLRHYNFKTGDCYPGNLVLRIGACMSKSTVWKALAWLEEAGFITKTVRKEGPEISSNVYRLVFPPWCLKYDGKGFGRIDISNIKPELLAHPVRETAHPVRETVYPVRETVYPVRETARNSEANGEGNSEGNSEPLREITNIFSPGGSLRSPAGREIWGPEEGSGESSGPKDEDNPAGPTLGAALPPPTSACLPPGLPHVEKPEIETQIAGLSLCDKQVATIAEALKTWTKGNLAMPLITRPGEQWTDTEGLTLITKLNEKYAFGVNATPENAAGIKPFITMAQRLLLNGKINERKGKK